MVGLSVLRVVSNDELVRREREAADAELAARQNTPFMLGLVAYLKTCWEAAKDAKNPIETKMLKAVRQRNGQYESDKIQQIRAQGGSEIYMMITEVKCRAAESWLRDILLDQGTPPWDIQPTPIPDLLPDEMGEIQDLFAQAVTQMLAQNGQAPSPQEMMTLQEIVEQDYRFKLLQAAQNRVSRMKDKIADQFAQGGWEEAFNSFITDLVTFPTAFIKGPIVRRQRVLGWSKDANGKTIAVPTERLGPEYERVDPFKIYPEPGVSNLNEGYVFEHHPMTRSQLADLIGVPGYDEQAIRMVLEQGAGSSWIYNNTKTQQEEAERKFNTQMRPTDIFDCLEFWGKIAGSMLIEWGMDEQDVPDPAKEYDACVWVCGNYVLKAVLNYDPLGETPYTATSFIKVPGALWGRGIPEVIEDIQGVCNAAARALVNNMGIASGPQIEVNLERIPANEDITQVFPWKIWQVTNDPAGSGQPAIRFTQPTDNSEKLMGVYETFSRLADDHSGIPAYLYGNTDVQGAGRTSSGLSMLMGSAGKGIRQVVMYIDNDVTEPIVRRQYIYNMRYDEDESIKGDVEVMARGAVNLAQKEQMNVRRIEFLNATANPIDMQIIGVDGRAAVLREVAKGLQMPADDVVPSREKMSVKQQLIAQQGTVQQNLAPASSTPTQPDGSPKGGQQGALMMNQNTGASA